MKILSITNNNNHYRNNGAEKNITNKSTPQSLIGFKGTWGCSHYYGQTYHELASLFNNNKLFAEKYGEVFKDIIKKLQFKLWSDNLFDNSRHHIELRWLESTKRTEYVNEGYGITGVKEPSSSPYVPTKFNYGIRYIPKEHDVEKMEVALIDVYKEGFLYPISKWENPKLIKCEFIYDPRRSTDQVAEDLYNTYKHLRYLKFYKK